MLAIDTNIIVRYLVEDDLRQLKIAARIVENESVFVPITVFLEVEWVLRALYRLPTFDVLRQMRAFARLPNVNVELARRSSPPNGVSRRSG